MTRLLLAILAVWLFGGLAPAHGQSPARPVVRIISTDFVLPAKFERMSQWASEAGYRLEWRYVEEGGAGLTEGAALLVFDGPRPNDMAAIARAVGSFDAIRHAAWIRVGGGPPASGQLAPEAARALIGYYAGGGTANLRRFVTAVPRVLAGGTLEGMPAPERMPAAGLYHPDADQLFASPEAFRSWAVANGRAGRPVVGFAISDGLIRDMQTQVIDALARAVEARGLLPALFWYAEADPEALRKVLGPLGAHALVNLTHMQNAPARTAEFEAMGIPVLQAIADRSGTPDQWRAAANGISGMSAAVMLSVPEGWGVSDPVVVSALDKGMLVPMPEQVELVAAKLARLVALGTRPAADKHLALFFWNYPAGEKNLAASNLNLPKSLAKLSRDLAKAGYRVEPGDEPMLIAAGQAMLGGYYRPSTLDDLLARGLAARMPVAAYRAWLQSLPSARRDEILARWGAPEKHWAVRGGSFIVPRLALGNLYVLPQPPRGGDPRKSYHDQKLPPDHLYLAAYLWVREQARADAIVHFGTHGTQEWTPGKDRGLWAGDYPFLLLGDLPVFYPYIQDNVAEAIQARRRGRAVTISHQTPAFGPSGLYDELRDIHALIHEYAQLEESAVRDRVARAIRAAATRAHLDKDLGWEAAAIERDFAGFYNALHDHLHQLARASIPLGLHSFGEAAAPEHRLTTVMQQLGPEYLKALGLDPNEAFAEDFSAIRQSPPYRTLARYLREGGDLSTIADPALRRQIERAVAYDRNLAEPGETEALLKGLAGGFVRPGAGGDPVRNPEVASGRNLYAFEAEKVPTAAAYVEGGKALDALVAAYRTKHGGAAPRKLAFSMFSGETIRTLGVGEGQILHALGLKPVWGRGGRVERLEIVPASELGRPRIDAVVQATSVYRDQFDGFMRQLAGAIDRLAGLDETSGPAVEAKTLEAKLVARGMERERARALARMRIFSNAPGDYGSGLPDRLEKDSGWREEKSLAEPFLERLQYAYGARDWGLKTEGANLFAQQLRDVDAAVLLRSSTLHGLLSTDHPFEYLGGMSLAVRSMTGRSPDLYVTDMRQGAPRVATAASFLSDELRARYLNPQWIGAMQSEGYAGANAMAGIVNNLWGWQVTDPGSVRADQWQAMHDTYVADARKLGLSRFFERVHPGAQLQIVERMLEAITRDYWKADDATRRSLGARRTTLRRALATAAAASESTSASQGYGFARPGAASQTSAPAPSRPPETAAAPPRPRGRILEKVVPREPAPPQLRGLLPALGLLFVLLLTGALLELRSRRLSSQWKIVHART